MKSRRKELIVGTVVVLATAIFIIGVRYFQDLPLLGGTYELYTSFEDTSGLLPGNAVRIRGVRVGGVNEISLDPETNEVRVSFYVEDGVQLPEGSQTEVSGFAALASVHLKVHPGPENNPPIEDGGFVPPMRGANLLGRLTDEAPELVDELDLLLSNANETVEEAERLLSGGTGDLPATLAAFRQAAVSLDELLRAQRGSLTRTLENVEAVSTELRSVTDGNGDSLGTAVSSLNQALRRLDRNLASLEATTNRLDSILLKIDQGDGTLGLMVNDPSLYTRLDTTVANLNALILDFQNDPARYLKDLDLVRIF